MGGSRSDIGLIYCAAGSKQYASIALDCGFLYGAQLRHYDQRLYYSPYFVDQDWRQPNKAAYIMALAKHQPALATVLDWEYPVQIDEVMAWVLSASHFVKRVVVIPKVTGGVSDIPNQVNDKPIVLGYSVPTRYAGTNVPVSEFGSRPVHLLGGSPDRQIELFQEMNVVSADGNMAQKLAGRCRYWSDGQWMPLSGYNGPGANYEAFRLSCVNILDAWAKVM